jgi:hypothetical protein
MVDGDGNPRPDILDIIPVFQYESFKKRKGVFYLRNKPFDVPYRLIFPMHKTGNGELYTGGKVKHLDWMGGYHNG